MPACRVHRLPTAACRTAPCKPAGAALGLDGAAATRALRAKGITTPVVALTADAFEEDRQACLAAGMDDFLTKPLDPHALRALLARVLSDGWTKAQGNAKLAS